MLSDTGEEEDVTIIIPESDFSIVKMLLQYIYSGEVIVDSLSNELEALIKDWVTIIIFFYIFYIAYNLYFLLGHCFPGSSTTCTIQGSSRKFIL